MSKNRGRYKRGLLYQRHRPEQGLFYRIVQSYWPSFIDEKKRIEKDLPLFIHEEFEKFLACGILENGFVRTYCHQCRYSGAVAFSCKKRGFCPSCCARRMNDEAAHVVDFVLPEVPVRQWVLSFPYQLRYLMACDQKFTNRVLRIFIQAVGSYQKRKAKLHGLRKVETGAVTFIQRFGSALNLNVHFHTLFMDGVFHKSGQTYEFLSLPQPSQEELYGILEKIYKKVVRLVEKMKENHQLSFDGELLGELMALSISQKAGFGERAGNGLRRFGMKQLEVDAEEDPFSAKMGGFSLNARVWIAAGQRKKLEHLVRYMARGPVAGERLSESSGQLLYKLKTKWRDGTTHISFSPLDFIARLVALIPPPKINLVRYHGCFAPNFKHRKLIVRQVEEKSDLPKTSDFVVPERIKNERLRWAEMLKRTFEIDVTVCPKCSGRLEQIAVITNSEVAKAILESLSLVTAFRPLKMVEPIRGPPADFQTHSQNEFDQRKSW